ncbi:helix-turn-helix transcriptional regulator [Cryptosporangium sp. NPDC051539]|uniref:helix-turn-helix transcriptional regulator n=1 Tax=Cryptosporangium sp. NPDC051539 TaxID=3363962 RepID=UPI0037A28D7F
MAKAQRDNPAGREELGKFLRSRRERLRPEDFGLVRTARRRAPGLLRYEVAGLAFVSDTWYTWLEQGRDIKISSHSMESVCLALQLDDDERDYVRRLAGLPVEPGPVSVVPRAELLALVDDMMPYPASLMTAAFDLVAWNKAHAVVFGDMSEVLPEHRNALLGLLMDDHVRTSMQGWHDELRAVIARFRYESGKYPGDARFAELIAELSESSAEFRDVWQHFQACLFVDRGVVLNHGTLGELHISKVQLRPIDQPSLLLSVHQAVDDETRQKLFALQERLSAASAVG